MPRYGLICAWVATAPTCRRVGQQLAHGWHGGGGGDTDLPGARAAGDDGKVMGVLSGLVAR